MVEFSLTLFGPEDGGQSFTSPKDVARNSENFNVTPQDFEFKPGGKIVQIFNFDDRGFYLSLNQQVYKIGSDRPGYTFGPGVLVSGKNIKLEPFLGSLFELHKNFTKECLNDLGKFNGPHFIGTYVSTIDRKYEILKGDIQLSESALIDYSVLKNPNTKLEVAGLKIHSIDDVFELSQMVNWYINSPASLMWKRLFIYENNSGEPLGNIRHIDSVTAVDINFFALYSAQLNDLANQKIEADRKFSAYYDENIQLNGQIQDLRLKIQVRPQAQLQVNRPPAGVSEAKISANQMNMISAAIDGLIKPRVVSIQEDLQKFKPQIKEIQSEVLASNQRASSNFVIQIIAGLLAVSAIILSLITYLQLERVNRLLQNTPNELSRMEERLTAAINVRKTPAPSELGSTVISPIEPRDRR